jgi:hypothetical protein
MAAIWLLHGSAGAVMVRNCDGAATTAFCSIARPIFLPEGQHIFEDICFRQRRSCRSSSLAEK